jgi:succinate dehydrogenase hydrophobic anchor subunit
VGRAAGALMDTYPAGMAFVVWGITGIVFIISMLQLACDKHGWPSLSYQICEWSSANPWLARGYVLLLFVLLAHFVLNQLHP